jgi:hypothetical protein
MKRILVACALVAAALAAGCGPKRTTAASQPTPAAFDASKSDAKMLAVVDAGTTALGGYDKWTAVKELRFDLKYTNKGKVEGWFRHAWDRWNGRHFFSMADAASLESGDLSKVKWLEIHYDIYDKDKTPWGTFKGQSIAEADVRKYVEVAQQRLNNDAYLMLMLFKLRDPGVIISDGGEVTDFQSAPDLCKPRCTTVKVTFDPAVGKDTWLVDYNDETHLPQMIERVLPQGRLAYRIDGWSDAGGLKWPAKLINIGVPDEVYLFEAISVGEPKDETYEAPVDRSQSSSTGNREPAKK